MRRFDVMAEQLKAVMHVQKEHKATKRDRGAEMIYEMPAPAPKRPAPFTLPKKAPISVKATQQRCSKGEESDFEEYADDDDSVLPQSSSKAPRKKLQPNWRFLGVKLNAVLRDSDLVSRNSSCRNGEDRSDTRYSSRQE